MKNSKLSLLVISLALLIFPCALMAQGNSAEASFKNLAGTADEMSRMRLPEAATLGIRSKAAMLPLRFQRDGQGNAAWSADVPVDYNGEVKMTLLAPESQDWRIRVTTGEGQIDLRQNPLVESQPGTVGLDGVSFPAEVFTFKNAKKGNWRVEIVATGAKVRASDVAGYLVIFTDSPYRLYSYLNTHQTLTGRTLEFVASVFDERAQGNQSVPEALSGIVAGAEMLIRKPGGETEKVILSGEAQGHFRGSFVPREAGQYTVQIILRGADAEGERFIRTSEHVFQVLAERVTLERSVSTTVIDDTRLRVSLPATGLNAGRKVVAYAEVWGRNANGEESPVAWISGMSIAQERRGGANVDLLLDARWLARGQAKNSYELRNVRLVDPDYFVTLAESQAIALKINNLPEAASRTFAGITEEMRTGKRPAEQSSTTSVTQAVGGKVLLIHGYCSGGNPFPTSQFTNYAVFSDPNQSRTHDQFAILIRNFGAQFPSFGAVAHSQGGAASLHLYTYYWSGLDYATGNRLIQSVGTPYQGTALAGNLAVLGQVFGAGCGSNANLTYSGAAAWLAGIPTWARARVHYSTTSFTDVWYRYDYCSLATDLFLSDPEDGVTERAYGQLPSANNRGHKTGWCHTSGMRDPAQTSDSSRNADMNANAAR
jgi:hypothetical protein